MKHKINFELELKKNPYPGLYIALEGVDGSGKTTQVEELSKYFKSQGREVVVTAEPSRQGAVGELIHKVLQQEIEIPSVAIQYLFSADRAVSHENLIIPALAENKVVISDRAFWSSVPYGILDRKRLNDSKGEVDQMLVALSILSFYHQFLAPDATIFLDVPVSVATERLKNMKQKAEIYEKSEFLEEVKKTYDWMLANFSDSFTKVDGTKSKEEIAVGILEIVKKIK